MSRPKCVSDLPLVFGPQELSQIMGMSLTKAYELVRSPEFPKTQIGRKYFIGKEHFINWLDEKMDA